jgi:hypothetical protein
MWKLYKISINDVLWLLALLTTVETSGIYCMFFLFEDGFHHEYIHLSFDKIKCIYGEL